MLSRFLGILFFTFALLVSVANGQSELLEGDEREHMIRDVLAQWPNQFQAIEITSVQRLDEHLVRMNYQSEGSEREAVLQTTGTNPILVETAIVLPPERWPAHIVDSWNTQADNDRTISRILRVSTPYGKQGFRVESLLATSVDRHPKSQYFDPFGMTEQPFF